jgi:hypothetical protein
VTVAADDRVVLLRLGRALTLTKAVRAETAPLGRFADRS